MPRPLLLQRFEVSSDVRGTLLPFELSEVPFAVRRVFTVTGPVGGATRGNHLVPCGQLLCLVAGSSEVRIGDDAQTLGDPVALSEVGEYVILEAGDYVTYTVPDESTTLLVLAEQPYAPRSSR